MVFAEQYWVFIVLGLISIFFMCKPKRWRVDKVVDTGDVVTLNQRIIRHSGATGKTIGRFIAIRNVVSPEGGDFVHIGFSLCDPKDLYRDAIAKKLATDKALDTDPLQIPANLLTDYIHFYERCEKYFKGCVLPTDVKIYDYDTKTYVSAKVESTPDCTYFRAVADEVVAAPVEAVIDLVEEIACPVVGMGEIPNDIDCVRCGAVCPSHPAPYTLPPESELNNEIIS